jgi:hypothetical protein
MDHIYLSNMLHKNTLRRLHPIRSYLVKIPPSDGEISQCQPNGVLNRRPAGHFAGSAAIDKLIDFLQQLCQTQVLRYNRGVSTDRSLSGSISAIFPIVTALVWKGFRLITPFLVRMA